MRVTRRRGVVRVNLDEVEIGLLRTLFADLADALRGMGDDDPVRRRMFPDGYRDDPEAAGEYRGLTESALLEQRQERLARALAELPPTAGEVTLDPDAATRWLTVLNDLRLAIGTRIGIDADTAVDDDLIGGADPDNTPDVAADRAARAVYVWLTALLDRLVEAVTD
ncbi:DUF2017 family protein [Jatrophihabitans sp. YIM 134969]